MARPVREDHFKALTGPYHEGDDRSSSQMSILFTFSPFHFDYLFLLYILMFNTYKKYIVSMSRYYFYKIYMYIRALIIILLYNY